MQRPCLSALVAGQHGGVEKKTPTGTAHTAINRWELPKLNGVNPMLIPLFYHCKPDANKKPSQWLHRCSRKNRVGVVRTFGSYQSATTRTSQSSPLLPLHPFPRFWLGRLLMNCPQYKQSKRALWYFAYFSRPKSWGNRQTICKNLWCGHSPSTKW